MCWQKDKDVPDDIMSIFYVCRRRFCNSSMIYTFPLPTLISNHHGECNVVDAMYFERA